ncbi:MAG TPA: peroxiredoxin [Pseudomonadales bacterium]|nr:peroxiredoxin [Pseudomonadales bacterium]
MTIAVGSSIPAVKLKTPGPKGSADITTSEIFSGKKVVLFAVPGAFTPTCSEAHLPGFVVHAPSIKAKGVDTIVCMAPNDAFVLGAWSKSQNAEEILMLADGSNEFAAALGLEWDARPFGLGMRCKRFAMIVEDGVVKHLAVDDKGLEKSSAEAILAVLG